MVFNHFGIITSIFKQAAPLHTEGAIYPSPMATPWVKIEINLHRTLKQKAASLFLQEKRL